MSDIKTYNQALAHVKSFCKKASQAELAGVEADGKKVGNPTPIGETEFSYKPMISSPENTGDKLVGANVENGTLPSVAASVAKKMQALVADGQNVQKEAANVADFALTPDFHYKLASAILDSAEGRSMAQRFLEKQAGIAAANELIENATVQQVKMAHVMAEQERQMQEAYYTYNELIKGASAEEIELIEKCAAIHGEALAEIGDDEVIYKEAYAQGAQDAAAMMDNGGNLPGAEATAPTLQEIETLLQEAVQNGEIAPEQAQVVSDVLQGSGQGGGMPPMDPSMMGGMPPMPPQGGAPMMDPGAGMSPEMAMGNPEIAKAASAYLEQAEIASLLNNYPTY